MSREDLPRSGEGEGTAERILDVAERLVQERGFNAFSYANVAGEVGITTASLHYHFPGKAQLGEALITRYARRFGEALEQLQDNEPAAPRRLAGYAELYAQTLRNHRMCLCGMLAADYETLAPPVRRAVLSFFDDNERWLMRVLDQGRDEGTLEFDGPARETARMLIGGLEGALLVARPYGDLERFSETAARLLASVSGRAADTSAGALRRS
jgi:TetR/AcrR family transcriptional regulator, transcriptional repressor for nem operon